MNNKKIKDTFFEMIKVSSSNIIQMISGILVGLILPKIIGVRDYGYYKTFTLYISYVGLFHFGISDGIYLVYGGKNYEDLDKNKFRLYTRFFAYMELIISLSMMIFSIFCLKSELRFIFISVAVYLTVNNLTSYFQMISQITKRFNELSFRNVLQAILVSISILALWLLKYLFAVTVTYRYYTLLYILIYAMLTIWYMITYKEIVFGETNRNNIYEILNFIKIGFPLMLSNLCLTLLITIDSQFVNLFFSTKIYAIYAFAYNLLALITTALNAISTVLYPVMKREQGDVVQKSYGYVVMILLTFVSVCMIIYFPLSWFVESFLPAYSGSLQIFRIILPGLMFSAVTSLVIHNYYKIENKTFLFFVQSLVVLVLSVATNTAAYLIFKDPRAISWASIIIMIVWYIISDIFLCRKYGTYFPSATNLSFAIMVMMLFYGVTSVSNLCISLVGYLIGDFALIMLFYGKQLKSFVELKKGKND